MRFPLTTNRHLTVAFWMAVKTIRIWPGIFVWMRRPMLRRVETCIETHEGTLWSLIVNVHFQLLFTNCGPDKYWYGHVFLFGLWNCCLKFVRTFQIHPVHNDTKSVNTNHSCESVTASSQNGLAYASECHHFQAPIRNIRLNKGQTLQVHPQMGHVRIWVNSRCKYIFFILKKKLIYIYIQKRPR
jgi:hypothetical protein